MHALRPLKSEKRANLSSDPPFPQLTAHSQPFPHSLGRLLPDGLRFVQSWPNKTKGICFQLMQTSDPALFDIWFACWSDLVEFEVFEVEPGKGP